MRTPTTAGNVKRIRFDQAVPPEQLRRLARRGFQLERITVDTGDLTETWIMVRDPGSSGLEVAR